METDKLHPTLLFVRVQNDLHRINYSDVSYIRAEGNYCYIITAEGGKFVTKTSLRQLLKSLPENNFVRVHKSYVLNLCYLVRINTKEREAFLDGVTLPIGRTFLADLTDRLMIL